MINYFWIIPKKAIKVSNYYRNSLYLIKDTHNLESIFSASKLSFFDKQVINHTIYNSWNIFNFLWLKSMGSDNI